MGTHTQTCRKCAVIYWPADGAARCHRCRRGAALDADEVVGFGVGSAIAGIAMTVAHQGPGWAVVGVAVLAMALVTVWRRR